jgi:hypothetical protein
MCLPGMYTDVERGWEAFVDSGELDRCETWAVVL